jgi:hypothetical protein
MSKCNRCGGSGFRWNNAAEQMTTCNSCNNQVVLSMAMVSEELQRKEYVRNHKFECVPWRGAGGEIGSCIYCGKKQDSITKYYLDRANGAHANRAR